MISSPSSPRHLRSLLHELYSGNVPWQRLRVFPTQSPAESRRGYAAVADVSALLRARVDPGEVERTGALPEGLMGALQAHGFLRLMIEPKLGGLGLSAYNTFRAIEAAAIWSVPVAFSLGIANGFGSGSYLPLLPEGPLKAMIEQRVADGIVSAGADAEVIGTSNQRRATTAIPVDGGAFYEISGEKVFIGNAVLADLMDVSATLVAPDGTEQVRLFFVSCDTPGFRVSARQEFMGLRGSTIGALTLDRVRVPAFHLMEEAGDGWRMRPGKRNAGADTPDDQHAAGGSGGRDSARFVPTDLGQLASLGRLLVIAPPSLAIAKLCLHWSRLFVNRRGIDGRGLGEYDEIQRLVAQTAGDVFAIESAVAWALSGHGGAAAQPDLTAAKNLTSVTCWRVVDRTVSLLGGEGYETAESKARRKAQPLPVERSFRDARALRVAGGVDFMVDRWSAEAALTDCYFGQARAGSSQYPADPGRTEDPLELSAACRRHLRFARQQARWLAQCCETLTRDRTPGGLFQHQRTVSLLGRIGCELLSMCVVLGRAASLAAQGDREGLALADVSCAGSQDRLASLAHRLESRLAGTKEPDYRGLAEAVLSGARADLLLGDLITDIPPTECSPEEKGTGRHE